MEIEGQLNGAERRLITGAITEAVPKPLVAIEVGTWPGGGSTLHILRALELNGRGHLWGIEVDRSIYNRMIANIRTAAPTEAIRFTRLFRFSQDILKHWKKDQPANVVVNFVFLDGGNNPREQMEEFELLDTLIPVGGQIMPHDAKSGKAGGWCRIFPNWIIGKQDSTTSANKGCFMRRKSPSNLRGKVYSRPSGMSSGRNANRRNSPHLIFPLPSTHSLCGYYPRSSRAIYRTARIES